jgi:hypothetical protein
MIYSLARDRVYKNLQRAVRVIISRVPFTLPRTRDIEDVDLVIAHETGD